MKYSELPPKHQATARDWALQAINDLYRENSLPLVGEEAPEVVQLYEEREYEIERGEYEPGIKYERLNY